MVAYSFNRRFVTRIQVGLGQIEHIPATEYVPKRQTIRAEGKRRHAKPGEVLQLYHGMRSSKCFKIGDARCVAVDDIRIFMRTEIIEIRRVDTFSSLIDKPAALDSFAREDGFEDWDGMRAFWREEHADKLKHLGPFHGLLIRWEPLS